MRDAEVIVVGGGPVGMGLAIELGQRGHSVVVVERHRDIQPIPKGQNLTQRTLEHFHVWGVEDEVRAASPLPVDVGIGGLTAYRTLLGDYAYDWYQRVVVRPYYFTDNARLPQYAMEAVLRRRVAGMAGVEVLYDWTAVAVRQDAEGADVEIAQREGAEKRVLRGSYVVGCDGSRSIVRQAGAITQTRSHHDMLMVLLVFHAPDLGRLMERYKGRSFFNVMHPDLEGYWMFFGRVDAGQSWFFHAPVPPGTTRENFDFAALIHTAVGATFDVTFEHIGFWDLRFATADTYRNGRLFIAGDAAHSHPPYGGFGVNSGLEDARNLGWKLAATLEGWGGANLLDTYSAERQPVFASTARDFIQAFIEADKAFLAAHDPDRDRAGFEAAWELRKSGAAAEIQAFEPHYEGSPIVMGPAGGQSSAVGAHTFKAQAGHHLAPQQLSSGKSVFEALGPGFTLVALQAEDRAEDRAVADFEAAASGLGMPLAVVRDSLADGRAAYEARLILVRPDHYVAWSGDALDEAAEAILRRAIGAR